MEDAARARMHEALGVVQPDPRLRARVMASLPVRERRAWVIPGFVWKPAGALVALVVAGALIISLILARNNATLTGPASTGVVGQGTIVNQVNFRCALPVEAGFYSTAFVQVQLPGGMVVNRSDPPPADLYPVSSYDVQAGRWLPVKRSAISPDGRFWAYGTGVIGNTGSKGIVHVVDLITGKDAQLWSGSGGAQVVGFVSTNIYVVEVGQSPPFTVWAVDRLHPGSARRVGEFPATWDLDQWHFGPTGAFGIPTGSNGSTDRIERMDLSTGAMTTWFTRDTGPANLGLLGLDTHGMPLLAIYSGSSERVLWFTGENTWVQIADGSNISFQPTSVSADSHGIWLGEAGSIWLYQPGAGLREVFAMPQSLFPAPSPKQFPPGVTPPPALPAGTPTGAEMAVIGPCN